MARFSRIAVLAALTAALGLVTYAQQNRVANTTSNVAGNITNDTLRRAGTANDALPGAWLSYGRTQGETRYSTLKQIDSTNVKRLGLAWSYAMGAGGGNQEGTPLMWNNTLYGITTWSVVFALDARTGKELWRWDPEINQTTVRPVICCGTVNRGIALYNGMIIAPAIDGRLFALNAMTGKPVWESRVVYPQDLYTLTMAPRIAGGKVIIGASGATSQHVASSLRSMRRRVSSRGAFIPSREILQRVLRAMRCASQPRHGAGSSTRTAVVALFGTASPTIRKPIWSTSAQGTQSRGCRSFAALRMSTIYIRARSSQSTSPPAS